VDQGSFFVALKSKRGFSLPELLIAIAIIGILSTVVVVSTSAVRAKARDTRRIADMKVIQLGLALYYDVYKKYPSTGGLDVLVTQKFIPSIPTDPAGTSYGAYEYLSYSTDKHYCLGVNLEVNSAIPNDNVTNAMNPSCNGLSNSDYKASR